MLAIVKNNINLLLAKKGLFFLLLVLPILLMALGLITNTRINVTMNLIVHDQDQSVVSQHLISDLEATGNTVKFGDEAAIQQVINQKADALLTIPKGLEARLLRGEQPTVSIASLKGQEITGITQAQINLKLSSLASLIRLVNPTSGQDLLAASQSMNQQGFRLQVDTLPHQVNRGLEAGGSFLVYIISINMLMVGGLILSDKAWNTLDRIRRAPVTRLGYLMANMLTGIFFLVINLIGIYLMTAFLFHIKTTPEMYFIWFVYGLVWIVIGIYLALIVPSNRIFGNVITIMTTIGAMLGGSFWPLYLVPEFMQKVAAVTPHYWANQWLESVQKGVGFFQKPQYLIALIGFMLLFFALSLFSLARKRKQQAFL